jgi:flagellar hook protein FlgE
MDAGVSGLQASQQMLDVIGNNVANVNTVGYKAARVTFADALSQTISGAATVNSARGGVNAKQIGLGVRVASTDLIMTQGTGQQTGRLGDLAIQGEGFFAVRDGQQVLFTRAGGFSFDSTGNLVASNGDVVQGWVADATTGKIDTSRPVTDIAIGTGRAYPPSATTSVVLGGNLTNDAAEGDTITTTIDVIDSLGTSHRMTVEFTKGATANSWTETVKGPDGVALGTQDLTFDPATGALATPTTPPQFTYTPTTGGVPVIFTTDYGTPGAAGALTQYGGETTAAALSQNGSPTGYLSSVSFAPDGTITGVFSNNKTQVLGQVATATFANPGGLTKAGDTMFSVSNNSGVASYAAPGIAGHAALAVGGLENSNVDLTQQLTDMIVAQRGFQANSRVISVSDQVLQDLVQLGR